MFSVIVDADGHERGPTSHHVIRTEIQRDVTLRCGYIILAIVWVVTVSLPLKDQRYQTSSKADNQTSNLPCICFYLFRRLHVPFLPKLLNDYIYICLIKRERKAKKSYILCSYCIQVILKKMKGKNLTLVTISQEYHVPNSHTYSEAVNTILFK